MKQILKSIEESFPVPAFEPARMGMSAPVLSKPEPNARNSRKQKPIRNQPSNEQSAALPPGQQGPFDSPSAGLWAVPQPGIPIGFLRLKQIIGDPEADPPIPPIIPVCRSAWWAGIRKGIYPAGIKLSPRVTVWRAKDVFALVESTWGAEQ
jgi:hypothetical protein